MRTLTICRNLFDAWNASGVRYCHWKGTANIEKGFLGESDLDIFVHPDDNVIAAKLLEQNNFVHFYTQWGLRFPFIQDWIGLDKETGILIHVHYHNKMMVGHTGVMEYTYPWEQEVLYSRILDSETGIYIISPEYEALTFFTRLGIEFPNKKIKRENGNQYSFNEEAKAEIDYIRTNINEDKLEALCNQFYGENGAQLFNYFKEPQLDKSSLNELSKLTKRTIPHEGFNFFNKLKSYYVMLVLHYIFPRQHIVPRKKVVVSHKGFSIAFLGQDGAGKSTVTKEIRKWLSWKLEVSQFYLGSGEHYQPWEKRLAEKLHGSNNPFAKLIRKWLPFCYLSKLGKNIYKSIIKARKYSAKGGIVLFDRYPQIQYVGINDGPKIRSTIMKHATGLLKPIANHYANREEKFLKKAVIYNPDLVIKLMLSPEESIRRKPHENYEMVKRKHHLK